MPEIAEVARVVHFLRKNLTNRRIASILTTSDDLVFNTKVGTSASSFAAALQGKTVLDARQQGKYFWLVMDSPPHPLFHFGMTGWLKFSNEETLYTTSAGIEGDEGGPSGEAEEKGKAKAKKQRYISEGEGAEWPPKFWKFVLKMEGEPACEAAFVDKRRLARIRLVDAAAEDMRTTTPLKENGPDPVIDKDILTADWLATKLQSKKVPVKALLLDQANISGVGNWVADEVLYHAKIHPEQYSNTFSSAQMKQLHDSLVYVCTTACDLLADSSKFPKEWLFKHRWDKGKKDESKNVMPSGEKIVHLKVGGRTSAVVLSVQKKTGPVAGDVEDGEADAEGGIDEGETIEAQKKTKPAKRKAKKEVEEDENSEVEIVVEPKGKKAKGNGKVKSEDSKETKPAKTSRTVKAKAEETITNGSSTGRRKSSRLSGA